MLTPKQAESAAAALAMRPETQRGDMLACPACGCACISPTARRHMGVIKPTPCPQCGAPLRLKWGRAVAAAISLILIIASLAAYTGWPADRHVVQSVVGPFSVLMVILLSAVLRRSPVTRN